MSDNLGFDAEIGIVVKGAKDAISTLENLRGVSADLDKQIDRMQRSLAGAVTGIEKVGTAAGGSTKGVKSQVTALQGLIREYNGLQKAATRAAAAQGPVGSAAALGTQKARELETARLEQKKYNDYVTASNARIAQAEIAAVQKTQQAVRAEREKSFQQAQVIGKAQTRAIAEQASREQAEAYKSYGGNIAYSRMLNEQEKAYESYSRNIVATAKKTAKEQQDAAFSTYANNMPAALKATQQASMDTYASNIRHTASQEALNNSLSNTRYALYDVASTLGVVSAATLGVAAATANVAINFERDFSQVERTSGAAGAQLQELRDDLVGISTSLPIAFSDVTGIATLGGQLGVVTDQLDSFTTTVAQFSATTNVTTDAAATGLGRLVQLTNKSTGSYEQYASAIYQVGINSVATESQILAVAQQIAVSGNLAGFTADQVIGLSGALASLGVQPESARGSIMRIFNEITKAADEGGESLEQFSNLSGMTASQFASAWENDPQRAFSAFIGGLSEAADNGENLMGILADLGVNAVRDQRAIQLLADNTEVYNQALRDSATAYGEGTALGEGYAIIADDVASRLQVLANTIQAIADAGTNLGPIEGVVTLLQTMATAILGIVNSPIGGTIASVVLAVGALVGILAGMGAAYALATASAYALRTANLALADGSGRAGLGVRMLAQEMAVLTVGTTRASAAQAAFSTSLAAGHGRLTATAAGAKAAATSVGGLAGAMRGLMAATGWGLALAAGITLMMNFANANAAAKARVEEITATLDTQTGALTENTRAWVAKNLEESGDLAKLQGMGVNTQTAIDAIMGETAALEEVTAALRAYAEAQDTAVSDSNIGVDAQLRAGAAANELSTRINGLADDVAASQDSFERTTAAIGATADMSANAAGGIDTLAASLTDLVNDAYDVTGGTVAIQNALAGLGESLAINGNNFSAFSESGRLNLVALQAVVSAMATASGGDAAVLATNIAGLMQSLGNFGVNVANDLIFLQNILSGLTGGKGVTGLPNVAQAANQADNALRQGFSRGTKKAASGAKKAGRAANKAAKEIRTLADYARDLSSVFDRAFDLQFGVSQARDDVGEIYQKITDAALDAAEASRDAAQAFEEAQARINSLNADNKVLRYQLGVAKEYKDALRVAEITAQIGENNKDLAEAQNERADAQKEMTKAQEQSSKTLVGDSEVARENRDTVESLVQAYQDQIAALATSGMSTAQLRAETARLRNQFVTQLTQMGYNRAEIGKYAAAFDHLGTIISRMPRKVTVSANVNPAQQAINEFLASNANKNINVGASLSGGGAVNADVNAGRINTGLLNVGNRIDTPNIRVGRSGVAGQGGQPRGVQLIASTGGPVPEYHATGGVHGLHPGRPVGTDTTPAWLTPGEFVHKEAAVDYYGLPFMTALNNMQIPKYLATGSMGAPTQRSGGISVVELSAVDRALLAAAGNVQVTIDGRVIAQAVSSNNTNQAQRGSN